MFGNLIGTSWGGYGVMMFFLLSAFLLGLSTEKHHDQFLIKRLIKLLPLYILITIFTFILAKIKPQFFNTTHASLINLLKSLLFIPYINPNGLVRPILDVAWALLPEIWLYVLYQISIAINFKYRNIISIFVLIILYFSGSLLFPENPIFLQYKECILAFSTGLAVYLIYVKIGKKIELHLHSLILFILFWVGSVLYNNAIVVGENKLLALLIAIIIFLVFLFNSSEIQCPQWLEFISNISYPLYLSHEFIAKGVCRLITPVDSVSLLNIMICIAILLVSIFIAYIINTVFNRPLSEKISKMLIDKVS